MNCTKFSSLQRYSFFGDRPPVVTHYCGAAAHSNMVTIYEEGFSNVKKIK